MIGFPALRGRSSFLMPPMEPPRSRSDVTFRRAERADVEQIVRLLANDPLGAKRGGMSCHCQQLLSGV